MVEPNITTTVEEKYNPQKRLDKILKSFMQTQQNEENRCLFEVALNNFLNELKHNYYMTSKNLDQELMSGPNPEVTVDYDTWNVARIIPNRFAKFLLEHFKLSLKCQ